MGISEWIRLGVLPQEIVPVMEGLKPLFRLCFPPGFRKGVKILCDREGLLCEIIDEGSATHPNLVAFISKSRENIEEYMELEKSLETNFDAVSTRMGELLGYPPCCVSFFHDYSSNISCGNIKNLPLVSHSLKNTGSVPSYLINNLLSIHSRYIEPEAVKLWAHVNKYSYITHIPCSYDCAKSIEYAKGVKRIFESICPEYDKKIVNALKKPFLLFDDANWASFEGTVSGNTILYERMSEKVFLSSEIFNFLHKGNELRVTEEEIDVISNGQHVDTIQKEDNDKGIIFYFS